MMRQFDKFILLLNYYTMEHGIEFGESQIDKEVKFLDTSLSISEDNNRLEYRLYKKDTDARNYLNTQSYHPTHVFHSVVFSQVIRVIERNSQDHTCTEDLEQLKLDLMKCGHKKELLEHKEPLAMQKVKKRDLTVRTPKTHDDKVVYSNISMI